MKNGDIDLESGDTGGAEVSKNITKQRWQQCNPFPLKTTNKEGEVMIPMTVMSEEEAATETKDEVTLQGVACDGTDMEPITDSG